MLITFLLVIGYITFCEIVSWQDHKRISDLEYKVKKLIDKQITESKVQG